MMPLEPPASVAGPGPSPEQPVVNLQILSPSVGVTRPLLFPGLPAATTIGQLKEKIRESLPLRPADEHQRLIHRGRALLRDGDSLSDVLGADALRSHPDQQTIHLVLRDVAPIQPPPPASPPTGSGASHAPLPASQPLDEGAARPASTNPFAAQPSQPPTASTRHAPFQTAATLAPATNAAEQATAIHRQMAGWVTQMQRETAAASQGSAPFHHRDAARQTGQTFHVETHYQTFTVPASTALAPGMQSHPLTQPPAIPSVLNADGSRPSAGRVVSGYGSRPPPVPAGAPTSASGLPPLPSQAQPRVGVWLLSTPQGPYAVVCDEAAAEVYCSPRIAAYPSHPAYWRHLAHMSPTLPNAPPQHQHPSLLPHHHQHHHQPRPELRQRQPAPDQAHRQPHNQHRPAMALHPNNFVAGGIPALMVQLVPHLWLMIRLGLFVWLFTSPTASWSRWFTIISLAVFLFALSTGILNGVAEHVWRPVGRHLENIFPAAEYARGHRREGGNGAPPAGEPGRTPDPSQMAERLVADRRGRESWLIGRARRVERAFLLFVASIAPGVAERHIAHVEAEARAEEARRREAEAAAAAATAATAAAAAAAAAAATATTTDTDAAAANHAQSTAVDVPESSGSGSGSVRQRQEGMEQRRHHEAGQEDLIALGSDVATTLQALSFYTIHDCPQARLKQDPDNQAIMSGGWNTIESDAGVFTSLLESLGVKNVQFEELLTLEPADLAALEPLYGVIFLFKYPTDAPYAPPSGPLDGALDPAAAQDLFFAAQTIPNACATQALLSVLLNRPAGGDVDVGAELAAFREFSMALPPDLRGEALGNSELIRGAHNSFARSSPFADETTQRAGDDNNNADDNAAFHFVAYAPVRGALYELDGLQPAPISHGACGEGEFPERVADVLRRRVARYDGEEIRFSLLAVCRDLRVRAAECGDEQLAAREHAKRRAWERENALRRHNFVGFAGELLRQVVGEALERGGDAAVDAWVAEGLERRRAEERATSARRAGRTDE